MKPQSAKDAVVAAAGRLIDRLKSDANALRILREWIGNGGEPVSKDLARQRADVCVACPHNLKGPRFEAAIGEAIREQENLRHGQRMTLPVDAALNTCDRCGCYLKLKVWVPMRHLSPRTRMADFPEHCWLRTESKARLIEKVAQTRHAEPQVAPVVATKTRRIVRIRRSAAHGDVLMATILATKLHHLGFDVHFSTAGACVETLAHHPHIARVLGEKDPVDVDLDGTYEHNMEKDRKSIALMLLEAAQHQLSKAGFPTVDTVNLRPVIRITDEEKTEAEAYMQAAGPRPWTIFSRRSFSWPNRTLSEQDFLTATNSIIGTVFCAQNDGHPGSAAKPLVHAKRFRQFMACVAVADLVVTPDTGPLHVAAGLGKPIVVIEQCNDTAFRVNAQTDHWIVRPNLECAPCHHFTCPIDAKKPPCQNVSGDAIAATANERLRHLGKGKVSAVIPVYKPGDRLDRCIRAVSGQVDEVIIALDGDANLTRPGTLAVPSSGKRLGYGKTCNRGAMATRNDWILFLNDDCYLNPGAVDAMLAAADERTAVVGCQLRYPDGTIQHGGQGRMRGDIGFGHIDHRRIEARITKTTECESVTFAAALVRRKAFYEVAAFDERYDCYSEDTDLCMKVRRAGWKVFYCPSAMGVHDESQSTSPMKEKMLREASAVFASKWRQYFANNPPGVLGTNWEGTK